MRMIGEPHETEVVGLKAHLREQVDQGLVLEILCHEVEGQDSDVKPTDGALTDGADRAERVELREMPSMGFRMRVGEIAEEWAIEVDVQQRLSGHIDLVQQRA